MDPVMYRWCSSSRLENYCSWGHIKAWEWGMDYRIQQILV
ncbi:hypothetical protein Goari_017376 [Gossypium aridum]|uniref:Uncharacterized protein n=1 Tax=Gossypium aridum TaxID=34290 RepID=A0A7J8WLC8_GOSAI|nr:hypothetical protein [Gossypium aridum]